MKQAEFVESLEAFFDLSSDLIVAVDTAGQCVAANRAWQIVLGLGTDRIIGKQCLELIHPDDREAFHSILSPGGEAPASGGTPWRSMHVDGSTRWISWSGTGVAEGSIKCLMGRDVTDRRLQLEWSRQIRNLSQFGGWELDLGSGALHLAAGGAALFGRRAAESSVGIDALTQLVAPACRNDLRAALWKLRRHRQFMSIDVRSAHDARLLRITAEILGDRIVGLVQDLTEKQQQDLRLENERQNLQVIANNIGDVIWMTNADKSVMEFVSPAYEDVWGRLRETLEQDPTSFIDGIHPDDQPSVVAALTKQPSGTYDETYRVVRPDGSIRWVRDRAFPIRDESGCIQRVVGIATDISSMVTFQDQIVAERERFATTLGSIPVLLAIVDKCGTASWANRFFSDSTGYDVQALREGGLPALFHGSDQDGVALVATLLSDSPGWLDCKMKTRDGRWLATSWTSIGRADDMVLIGQDISERIADRERVLLTSKLAALGEMAGGIAHEINNPLTIIIARARNLLSQLDRDPSRVETLREFAKSIVETGWRIDRIVKGLRTFARDGDQDPMELAPVTEIVEVALNLCRERLKNNGVDVRVDLRSSNEVMCRSTQLVQILVNLLNNSFDAVATLADRWIEIGTMTCGSAEVIAVTDSGGGLAPEIQAKILHPFYTSKPSGKGTGLGLGISRRIAEQHGGRLFYDPASPNTRFVLELPRSLGEEAA